MTMSHLKQLAAIAPDLSLGQAVPIIEWISGMLGPAVPGAQTPDDGAGVATTMTHAHPAPAPEVAASGAGDELTRGRWTTSEEDLAWKLKNEGLTARQIAMQLGRPYTATEVKLKAIKADRMSAALGAHGTDRNGQRLQQPPWSQHEIETAQRLRAEGRTFAQIAQKLGRSAKATEVALGRERRARAKAAAQLAEPPEIAEPVPQEPDPAPVAEVIVSEGPIDAAVRAEIQDKPVIVPAPEVTPAPAWQRDPSLTVRQHDLLQHLCRLSQDDFTPADDMFLVEELAKGTPGNVIADQLGCDLKLAARRFRSLQTDDIVNAKGVLTIAGQTDLLVAVRHRARHA